MSDLEDLNGLEDLEVTVKAIVVGDGGVGKTSLTTRYARGRYTDNYKKTVGVDFMERSLELDDGTAATLMIWDTAGQEIFHSLTSRYFRGAGVAILVFSTVDRETFEALPRWKEKVEEECGEVPMVLVQNKVDLVDRAAVTPGEAEGMARSLGCKLYRVCVKDNVNVDAAFEGAAKLALEHMSGEGAVDTIEQVAAETERQRAKPRPAAAAAEADEAEAVATGTGTGAPAGADASAASDATKAAATNGGPGSEKGGMDGGGSSAVRRPPGRPRRDEGIVHLTPRTRRTGGRKEPACALL